MQRGPSAEGTRKRLNWAGPWPVETAAAGSDVRFTGTVVHWYNAELRREGYMTGYMAGTKSADAAKRAVAVQVQLDRGQEHILDASRDFMANLNTEEEMTFATDPPTITILGDDTLIGNLRSASEVARLNPLIQGDKVSVVTRGGSNLIKTFEVTQYAPRDERQDGMHGTTHVYGRGAINVDQGFAANIMKARAAINASASAAASSSSKKDDDSDDDW